MKMVAALFVGRNEAFLNNSRRMRSRRIIFLSIAIALAAISAANVCHASEADDCAFDLKQYLEGDWRTDRISSYPPCDERQYEELKNTTCPATMKRKFQESHALCQSIKATQQDFDGCNQSDDPKRTKIGCTHVINDQSQSLVDRLFAFVQIGNSYATKERDFWRAKYYYAKAIEMDPKGGFLAHAARAVANWQILESVCNCTDDPQLRNELEEAIADYRSAYAIDPVKMNALTASSEDLKKLRAFVNK
jgi:tetratricopeptide (TPR) repeat protein